MPATHTIGSIGDVLQGLQLDRDRDLWLQRLDDVTACEVEAALDSRPGSYHLSKLLALISPAAEPYLE